MAQVVLENPFFVSKYLRMFDLSAKGAYHTFDVSYPSQPNRAFHMQSFLAKSKGGTDPKTSLIISDEAPMMNRGFFEVVDRVVRDIMKNESGPSGRKVIVFSRHHRQILPIYEKIHVNFVLPKICAYEPPQIQGIWPNSLNSCFKLVKVATR
ncbi:Helitron helicase [Phytophthora megakarya]|uniref:ATP-dependent DNA helicase n=1 Tax=Phytophthora megakarya TaxID=4795 RepID=A0A225V831_9STRA|nr:Helitron helicase [Phytophthora megakarya]